MLFQSDLEKARLSQAHFGRYFPARMARRWTLFYRAAMYAETYVLANLRTFRKPPHAYRRRDELRNRFGCPRVMGKVITVCKQAATGVESAPFQNPSRNGTCERLTFQHPSRAILVFQKDLFLEEWDW